MKFTVSGAPCGKGRPRVDFEKKRIYTPEETVNYETLVKLSYQQAAGGFFLGKDVPVRIIAIFKNVNSKNKPQTSAGSR